MLGFIAGRLSNGTGKNRPSGDGQFVELLAPNRPFMCGLENRQYEVV
jgi:hypothetical protein